MTLAPGVSQHLSIMDVSRRHPSWSVNDSLFLRHCWSVASVGQCINPCQHRQHHLRFARMVHVKSPGVHQPYCSGSGLYANEQNRHQDGWVGGWADGGGFPTTTVICRCFVDGDVGGRGAGGGGRGFRAAAWKLLR